MSPNLHGRSLASWLGELENHTVFVRSHPSLPPEHAKPLLEVQGLLGDPSRGLLKSEYFRQVLVQRSWKLWFRDLEETLNLVLKHPDLVGEKKAQLTRALFILLRLDDLDVLDKPA